MIYLFRLIYASVWFLLTLIIDIVFFLFTFKIMCGFEVNTQESWFFIPLDTLGEHGLWKSYFHWALKIEKHIVI